MQLIVQHQGAERKIKRKDREVRKGYTGETYNAGADASNRLWSHCPMENPTAWQLDSQQPSGGRSKVYTIRERLLLRPNFPGDG